MKTSLIVAMGRNRVIGREGGLPWHLSGDLKFFKAQTMGKPIIMGRVTYESIGRPLPGRPTIVITRSPDFSADGVDVVTSLDDALALAAAKAAEMNTDELMVIGGAQIYGEAFSHADKLYITEVDLAPEGDAWFPEFSQDDWREISREPQSADGPESPCYDFVILERASG